MSRFLLDTGTAQDFINHRNGVLERAIEEQYKGHRIGICVPVLGELWSGVEGSLTRERNLRLLRAALTKLVVWPYDNAAAEIFGRLFIQLRRIGRPMQQIDVQAAAIAFALGDTTVVTVDSDLFDIPDLQVENWSA